MPRHSIFYSWQSDLPNSINRGFIQECLERAIKQVGAQEDLGLDPSLERDTQGVAGAQDVAQTIFAKIDAATVFVSDVSFVTPRGAQRPAPNPNVLIELGYAAKALGWENVVCVFNAASGRVEDLPFDIRKRIIRVYALIEGEEKTQARTGLVGQLRHDITGILHRPDQAKAKALSELISSLAPLLSCVIILGSEIEDRLIDPWFSSMRHEFESIAAGLRDLAARDVAQEEALSIDLDDLAIVLDQIVHFHMHLGCGDELTTLVHAAVERAGRLKADRVDTLPLAADSITEIRQQLIVTSRKLQNLAGRAESMAEEGRLEELQENGSRLGRIILELGSYNLSVISPDLSSDLQLLAHPLHSVETILLTHGTECVRSIVATIRDASESLGRVVERLEFAKSP